MNKQTLRQKETPQKPVTQPNFIPINYSCYLYVIYIVNALLWKCNGCIHHRN